MFHYVLENTAHLQLNETMVLTENEQIQSTDLCESARRRPLMADQRWRHQRALMHFHTHHNRFNRHWGPNAHTAQKVFTVKKLWLLSRWGPAWFFFISIFDLIFNPPWPLPASTCRVHTHVSLCECVNQKHVACVSAQMETFTRPV